MTTIPPPSALAPPVPAAAGSTVTAVLTQLPSSLQSAGPGTVVSGTVVSVDPQGQIVLQTNAGLVSLQSAANVAVGQQVSLQIQATGGGQAQAIVLSVEALATAETAALAAAIAEPSAAAQEAAPPAATIAPSVATGSIVIATVIGPGTAAPSLAPAAPSTSVQQAPASSGSSARSTAAQTPAAAPTAGRSAAPAPSQPTPASPASAAAPQAASPPPAVTPRATVTGPANAPAQSSNGAPMPLPASAASPQASASSAAVPEPANALAETVPPTASSPAAAPTAPNGPMPTSAGPPAAQTGPSAGPIAVAAARYAAALPPTGTDGAPSPGTAPAGSAASLPMPPAGTQIPLRFVGPLPTLTAAAASASNGQLVATVVAVTPAGQVVVDTAIGRLALNASPVAENAAGSQIAFEVAAPATRPSSAASAGAFATAASRGLAGLTTEWPALKAVLTTLADIDPRLAQQVVETALPRPDNPQFLSQILSLINSPAEDVKMLLGQAAATALQNAGRGDVMTSLNTDLRQMARLNAAPSDWRVFYVPLFDSTEARQLRIFTRRRSKSDPRRDSGGRFVVEVEFEELGPLQLDGLVQKPRLDLILRTHVELPATLQTGITGVFGQTCDAAGLQGKIFFQAIPTFPVSPLDEMTSSSASGLTV